MGSCCGVLVVAGGCFRGELLRQYVGVVYLFLFDWSASVAEDHGDSELHLSRGACGVGGRGASYCMLARFRLDIFSQLHACIHTSS